MAGRKRASGCSDWFGPRGPRRISSGVCTVRDVERVTVFSPNRERRVAFAERMESGAKNRSQSLRHPAKAARGGADIVVVATNTTARARAMWIAFRGGWARAGMHINAIGSTMPKLREIDPDSFARAERIVIDCQTRQTRRRIPGDIIDALAQRQSTTAAELSNCRKSSPGAHLAAQRTTRSPCSSPSALRFRT